MKKQMTMLLSALLVLFMVFPAISSQAAEVTTQEAQEFELSLDVLKVESDETSTAGDFVESPARIVIEDGKTYAYVTLLQSKFWQSLKVQTTQPGTFEENNFIDAEVVSENEVENERVVKFEVKDLTKVLNIKAHIIVTGVPGIGEYDHSYDLRLKFDSSEIPEIPEEDLETPEIPEPETPEPETPEVIEDGAYTIDFNVLHEEEDKASSMARYIETPALLTVKDGKNLVTFKLTNNEQITVFQVEQGGEFVDATVVETDEEENTRTVEFEVADFAKILNAKVQVYVESVNHTGNYTVRLAFDKESIAAVTDEDQLTTFEDIVDLWAQPYIESLASKEIILGLTPTKFGPHDKITRAQFAVLLSRALDLPKENYEGTFSDVSKNMPSAVYEIEAAERAGITFGSGGKFFPNEQITRQQMAAMIIRAIDYKDASVLEDVTSEISFTDANEVDEYAVTSVELAAGLGIISGREIDGKLVFEPQADATRAHAAKMIYYLLETLQ